MERGARLQQLLQEEHNLFDSYANALYKSHKMIRRDEGYLKTITKEQTSVCKTSESGEQRGRHLDDLFRSPRSAEDVERSINEERQNYISILHSAKCLLSTLKDHIDPQKHN